MKTIIQVTPYKGIQNKFYYLYKIINNINGHFYYGVHTAKQVPNAYNGSGSRLHLAYKKYGIENFTKYIVEFFNDHQTMLLREAEIVNQTLVDDSTCYNLCLGGGELNSLGKTVVRDVKTGQILQLSIDDPRIGTEYISINEGRSVFFDSNLDKYIKLPVNDPRVLSGEVHGPTQNRCCVRDKFTGEVKQIDCSEFDRNKYESVVAGTVSVQDNNGDKFRVRIDDPRLKTGELKYHTSGRTTAKFKDGTTISVSVDDPRLKTGELINVNRHRIYINDGYKNRMVPESELQTYLDNGWELGMVQKNNRTVHRGNERIMVPESELQTYLDNGWELGQGKTKPKSGRPKIRK